MRCRDSVEFKVLQIYTFPVRNEHIYVQLDASRYDAPSCHCVVGFSNWLVKGKSYLPTI